VFADDNAPLSTRFAAVMAVGSLGPKAKSAAEALKKVTEDDDTNLAMAAKVALKAVSAAK
jgi:ATP-dependent protease HslVU (ClpYQ) peptidase subunit